MPAAATITLVFLIATVLLLVLAQLTKRESRARSAAIASIITILIADYYLLSAVREGGGFLFERGAQARKEPLKQNAGGRRNGGGGSHSEGAASGPGDGAPASNERHRGASEDSDMERAEQETGEDGMGPQEIGTRANALARSFAGWLGSHIEREPAAPGLTRIDTFTDCPDCPEMVRIAPGERHIGVPAGDPTALPGEQQARSMRVWPGFAVSRFEITAEQLARSGFTGSCATGAANGASPAAATPATSNAPAVCITASDISNYLAWLKFKTGRRYRLPSAAEWEFAARATSTSASVPERMADGVAEIVADCWPAAQAITLVARTNHAPHGACAYRVVKGAADNEPAQWRRASARRAIPADAASPLVGFRILRDFDLTASKGF